MRDTIQTCMTAARKSTDSCKDGRRSTFFLFFLKRGKLLSSHFPKATTSLFYSEFLQPHFLCARKSLAAAFEKNLEKEMKTFYFSFFLCIYFLLQQFRFVLLALEPFGKKELSKCVWDDDTWQRVSQPHAQCFSFPLRLQPLDVLISNPPSVPQCLARVWLRGFYTAKYFNMLEMNNQNVSNGSEKKFQVRNNAQ